MDPYQIPVGEFLALQNIVFDEVGALTKRNGYDLLTTSPAASYLTTFNSALTSIGPTLQTYSTTTGSWLTGGAIQPLSLSTQQIIANGLNQVMCDSALAPNGLLCTVYTTLQADGASYSSNYTLTDSSTTQVITKSVLLTGATYPGLRVFVLGGYFVILYTDNSNNLNYYSIEISNPSVTFSHAVDSYVATAGLNFDGVVVGTNLFIGYSASSTTFDFKVLTAAKAAVGGAADGPTSFTSAASNVVSLCSDGTYVYATFSNFTTSIAYTLAVNLSLTKVMNPTGISVSGKVLGCASGAINGTVTSFLEYQNNYSYASSVVSHYLISIPTTLPATLGTGSVGTPITVLRSVGLASKVAVVNSNFYLLAEYQSLFQPTYFLINASLSTQSSPVITAKLAYGSGFYNGNTNTQYQLFGFPSLNSQTVSGITTLSCAYLYQDLIASASKATTGQNANPAVTVLNPLPTSNVYSQYGVKYAFFQLGTQNIDTAEIGQNLNISGGFLSAFDGSYTTEQNFFLWPENITASWSTSGGSMHAQPDGGTNTDAYWYQITYEWTDHQGLTQRSAPSIPLAVTTTGSGTSGSVTLNIPYLRLTYKTGVNVVIYRWSVDQQVYYQVTSITAPQVNNPTSDSFTYVDTQNDASILGGTVLYTTGGVVENVNAPACNVMTLFDDRLWLVNSEDPNQLWYSKSVIENTSVEMSDLFTFYIAPTIGAQGSTGPITGIYPQSDKLIVFKKDAIYYINGSGPDSTGSNSGYNGPIFISSTVGSVLEQSIVLTPSGLMFQSDKGIWLLNNDTSVSFIGAAVQSFTNAGTVTSALCIPGTNQVRFTMSQGVILLYDYFVGQWASFNIAAVSSTLFQGLQTYLDTSYNVYQETPGQYLDGSNPVLISFTTGWLAMAGIRGYERIYEVGFLGDYYSPHYAQVTLNYDFGVTTSSATYTPENISLEQWRIFAKQQKCKAFQISFNEIFNSSAGQTAGEGISLSALNCVVSLKKSYSPIPGRNSVG